MKRYSVNIYRTLQNDQGHNFKCLQQQYTVSSLDPVEALATAQPTAFLPLTPVALSASRVLLC